MYFLCDSYNLLLSVCLPTITIKFFKKIGLLKKYLNWKSTKNGLAMNKTNPGAIILRLKDHTNITCKINEILHTFGIMLISSFQIVRNLPMCVDCPSVLKYIYILFGLRSRLKAITWQSLTQRNEHSKGILFNIMQQLYHLVVLVCFGLAYSENALPEQVHLSFGSKYYDQQERVVLYILMILEFW